MIAFFNSRKELQKLSPTLQIRPYKQPIPSWAIKAVNPPEEKAEFCRRFSIIMKVVPQTSLVIPEVVIFWSSAIIADFWVPVKLDDSLGKPSAIFFQSLQLQSFQTIMVTMLQASQLAQGTPLYHIHWLLNAYPQMMASFWEPPTNIITFHAWPHLAFSLSEIPVTKPLHVSASKLGIAPLILLSRPLQISVTTVLFIPLPIPCHLTPLSQLAKSMVIRMIAKLPFLFINLLLQQKKKNSNQSKQASYVSFTDVFVYF